MTSEKQKRALIQGELADLALYEALRRGAHGNLAKTLDTFITTEKRHAAFWQKLFNIKLDRPSIGGQFRNLFIRITGRIFGNTAIYLFLEAVESHGIKHYLRFWKEVKDKDAQAGLRKILTEEFEHEDEMATGGSRTINPDVVRNAFLGFNDGSVEILGAVAGLHAALSAPLLVATAGATVSIAGALSMAAGAFLATHAEHELEETEREKEAFLTQSQKRGINKKSPWNSAVIVGIGYLIGAAVPIAPFFFGATNPWWSIVLSGTLILIVSGLLAFLSGMQIRRRILLNIGIIIVAVLISYFVGTFLDSVLNG